MTTVRWVAAIGLAIYAVCGPAYSSDFPFSKYKRAYAYPIPKVDNGRCFPTSINESGEVAGYTYKGPNSNDTVGFFTGPNGQGATALTRGRDVSKAMSIDSGGKIVGSVRRRSENYFYGLVTDNNGGNLRAVGEPGTFLTGATQAGRYVGYVLTGDSTWYTRAFVTDENGENSRLLDTGPGFSNATGINELGEVVGYTNTGNSTEIPHAFKTGPDGQGLIYLQLPTGTFGKALGINDSGEVVGYLYVNGKEQPFFASRDNTVQQLGLLHGHKYGMATGINNSGIIVGRSDRGGIYYVTVGDAEGHLVMLDDVVVNLPARGFTSPIVINNRNQIAVSGTDGMCYIVCPAENCAESR